MDVHYVSASLLVIALGIGVADYNYQTAPKPKRHNTDSPTGYNTNTDIVPNCVPDISAGSHTKLKSGGHTSFECEISTCLEITKIKFEKAHLHTPTQWISVYEGFNKTHHKALDTVDDYTLKERTEYAAFPTQHILYINNLELRDHGRWRCVVYDGKSKRLESKPFALYFAPVCEPEISHGSHSKLKIGGHASFECEISKCVETDQIIFEKNNFNSPNQWTSVFEGFNMTHYNALNSVDDYTLKHRTEYAAFRTQHILYIDHLNVKDSGKWRCVSFDTIGRRAASKEINFYIPNHDQGLTVVKPFITGVITNRILEFCCEVSVDNPKHIFTWRVNDTDYGNGISIQPQNHNGLWLVTNYIEIPFEQFGQVSVGCQMDSVGNTDTFFWENIVIDVKESETNLVTERHSTELPPTFNQPYPEGKTTKDSYHPNSISIVLIIVSSVFLFLAIYIQFGPHKKKQGSGTRWNDGIPTNPEPLNTAV